MELNKLLNQVLSEVVDKTILTSSPKMDQVKKFHETTERLMKMLKNSSSKDRSVVYNTHNSDNMFTPPVVTKGDIMQHMGEYNGDKFKNFAEKISEVFEKAGFTVKKGYGINEVNGYEIYTKDGDVVGEVDFLPKNSVNKFGDTVIIKHKK